MDISLQDFDMHSIIKDILKNWFYILLAGITAVILVGSICHLTYTPKYKSTSTLAIMVRGNDGGSFSSLNLTNEMAGVLGEVFQSETLKNKIQQDLGTEKLNGVISVNILEETNLLELNVESKTPRDAYLIIESALRNYDDVSDYLFSNARLQMLKSPVVPTKPSNPDETSQYYLLAFFVGVLSSMAVVVLLSFLRPTVKNAEEGKRKLDGRILGVIPRVKKYETKGEWKRHIFGKSKKKEAVLMSSARVNVRFVEAVRKLATVFDRHMTKNKQKILLILSIDKNEGKSSVAANLAIALADKGKKVLLIDADLRKPALYKIFEEEQKGNNSFSDYLNGKENIVKLSFNQKNGIYCIYQFESIADAGTLLAKKDVGSLLERCRESFDYIVIDSSPLGRVSDAENLIPYCDAVTLTVREDETPIALINDYTDIIRKTNKDFVGFILNAFTKCNAYDSKRHGYGYYSYAEPKREEKIR